MIFFVFFEKNIERNIYLKIEEKIEQSKMLLETQKLCKELLATSKNATNFSIAELLKKETSERRSISE